MSAQISRRLSELEKTSIKHSRLNLSALSDDELRALLAAKGTREPLSEAAKALGIPASQLTTKLTPNI